MAVALLLVGVAVVSVHARGSDAATLPPDATPQPAPCPIGAQGADRFYCPIQSATETVTFSPSVIGPGDKVTMTLVSAYPNCSPTLAQGTLCWTGVSLPANVRLIDQSYAGQVIGGGKPNLMLDSLSVSDSGATATLTVGPGSAPPGWWAAAGAVTGGSFTNDGAEADFYYTGQQSQPPGSLQLTLAAGHIAGDILHLQMTVTNTGTDTVSGITYGDPSGISQTYGSIPADEQGTIFILGADRPPPSTLDPGQSATVTYGVAGVTLGFDGVTASAQGTDTGGNPVTASTQGTIEIDQVTPTSTVVTALIQDQFASVANTEAGQFANLQTQAADYSDWSSDPDQGGTPHAPTRQATPWQQALARAFGYADNTFAYLPQSGTETVADAERYATGFAHGAQQAISSTIAPFGRAGQFWYQLMTGSDTDRADAWNQLIAFTKDTTGTVGGQLSTAYGFYTSPQQMQAAWSQLPQMASELLSQAQTTVTDAYNQIEQQDSQAVALARSDFGAYSDQVGTATGQITTQAAIQLMTDAIGQAGIQSLNSAINSGALKGITGVVSDAGTALEDAQSTTAAATETQRLTALNQLPAGAALTVDQLAQLGGISAQDATAIQTVIQQVEAKYPGVTLEIQARPVNPLSADLVGAGTPKPEPVKFKSVTADDILLGADPAAAGKVGVFDPVKPSQAVLDAMDPADAQALLNRYDTRVKDWSAFNDPTSKARQDLDAALQPGGNTFTLDFGRQLHVSASLDSLPSGTTIINDAARGQPFISDIDFQNVVNLNGKWPPGVRSQVELDVIDGFRKNGVSFGQHGWTMSGFDMSATQIGAWKIRARYELEFLPPAQAQARAQQLADQINARFPGTGLTGADLLKGVDTGQYVIKFRAGNISTGPGTP